MPSIKIESDFTDWYDGSFARPDEEWTATFDRNSNQKIGMTRQQRMLLLQNNNIETPIFGKVADIANSIDDNNRLVICTNNLSQFPSLEIVADRSTARELYPQYFSYVASNSDSDPNHSINYLHLQIADRAWEVEYARDLFDLDASSFRYQTQKRVSRAIDPIVLSGYYPPMFAISFVKTRSRIVAIDFDRAPNLDITGIRELVSADDIYDLIYSKTFVR